MLTGSRLALDTDLHRLRDDVRMLEPPVITRFGRHFASRVCERTQGGRLSRVDARDLAAFVALGMQLADDRSLLASYRNRLADGRKSAPLFDTARSVRAMEHGVRGNVATLSGRHGTRSIDIPDR